MTLNPPPSPSTRSSMISSWLEPHRTTFLESLAEQGYSKSRRDIFRRLSGLLCAEARARHLVPDGLDADIFRTLADTCPKTGTAYMERNLAMVTRRFTDYLVQAGVVAAVRPPPPAPGSPEQLCEELDHWLRHHRGMFGSRLRRYPNQMKEFLSFFCTTTGTVEDLASLTPDVLFTYLHRCSGKSSWRILYVRNLLRFLFYSGRTPQDLSMTIPRMATTRPPDGSPRHLQPDVVQKLLEGLCGNQPRALRDVAMFLLMARLGLRAQEVIALRLEDIDWGGGSDADSWQRPTTRPHAHPGGCRRSPRRLAAWWAQGERTASVRLRPTPVCPLYFVPGSPHDVAHRLSAGQPESAPGSGSNTCPAPQPGHGTAGSGIVPGGDRRCPAPSFSPVDHRVCPV